MVRIQVLGLGCPKCNRLAGRVEEAARRLGLTYELEKVRDLGQIVDAGAAVPALAINGRVVAAGKVPGVNEIERLLREVAATQDGVLPGDGVPARDDPRKLSSRGRLTNSTNS